jgi:hypothetical protein
MGEYRMSGAEMFVNQEHSDSERLEWLEANLERLETVRAGIRAGMSIRTAIDLQIEGVNY